MDNHYRSLGTRILRFNRENKQCKIIQKVHGLTKGGRTIALNTPLAVSTEGWWL